MGEGGACDGNLYMWIGSNSKFYFGVQCNGQGSDGALESTTVAQANTDYDLKFQYDSTTAEIFVNGVQEASAAKSFNYFTTVTKITVGAGIDLWILC